ncbi:metallophosphoesterase [Sphingobacteriaceae bacterium]|nr:metallophosphoesterase [Sphingobacteriaceae bacterium]
MAGEFFFYPKKRRNNYSDVKILSFNRRQYLKNLKKNFDLSQRKTATLLACNVHPFFMIKISTPFTFLVLLLAVFYSCKKFEYSPYQKDVKDELISKNLNALNITKLLADSEHSDDTVTIVYSGDSQRFYDELESLVKKVNTLPNIDFFVLAGDVADFALAQEYLWVEERLRKLNVPFLCAVGNHDLIEDNGEIYTKLFGEKNYSFIYKDYKFLFHDTNGREYGFDGTAPNLSWMDAELKDKTPKWFVGVSHISPYNEDFDKSLEQPYRKLLNSTPGFIVSLHAHLHGATDSVYYDDGVRYMTANAIVKKEFIVLKFIHGTIIKQILSY